MAEGNVVPIKPNPKIKSGKEFVSGSPYLAGMPRALPPFEDHLDVGGGRYITHRIIDEMLCDPDVYAALMLVTLMALSEDIIITPAITETPEQINARAEQQPNPDLTKLPEPTAPKDQIPEPTAPKDQIPEPTAPKDQIPDQSAVGSDTTPQPAPVDPKIAQAKEYADFLRRQFERVPKLKATLFEMVFQGMAHGNKVAEIIYEVAMRGTDTGKWCLKNLKTKPRNAVAFVVDAYMNELGLLGAQPGQMAVVTTTMVPDSEEIIPREKFAVFTYRPTDNDPRGNTALMAALNGWDMKRRTFPEYLIFLMVSAIPGIIATVKDGDRSVTLYEDDGTTPKTDIYGNVINIPMTQFVLQVLSQMRNHQVGVLPEDVETTLLEANSDGDHFPKALDKFGSEITMAILFQQLATRDAAHQTKGSTGSQARVIDQIVWWVRSTLADVLRYDVGKNLIRWNYGDDASDELLPKISCGDTEAREWTETASAVAQMAPICTESQLDHLFTQIGIPLPTEAERAMKRFQKQLSQQGVIKSLNSDGGDTPSNSDSTSSTGDKKPPSDN